jgi:two-component system, OmpR family, alkaline phosphatase synthesis response regulator PhoP
MNGFNILLVEDEPGLVLTLSDLLSSEGYEVAHAGDCNSARLLISGGGFDALILDLMLPDGSGLDLLGELRTRGDSTPVLVLTARSTIPEKVAGLRLGADDYMSKPFDSMELLARVEAIIRRSGMNRPGRHPSGECLRFGDIEVDAIRSEVRKDGIVLPLAVQEYRLLLFMLAHEGETLSRDRLLEEVWGYDVEVESRTVDVHVSSLRQKLGDHPSRPRWIVTVRGFGYRFEQNDRTTPTARRPPGRARL